MGSIRKIGNRWHVRYEIPGGDGKRHQRTESCGRGATRGDAEKLLAERLRQIDATLDMTLSTQPVRRFLQAWRLFTASRVTSDITERWWKLIELHVLPQLGHVRAGSLHPYTLQRWLDELERQCVDQADLTELVRILTDACHWGEMWGALDTNPMLSVRAPKVPDGI